jgi:glutathione S-transferase
VSYKLYYSPGSSNLVVRMVFEELGIDYADIQVPRKRVDRDVTFLKLNPRGLVPVVTDEDNDLVLFETAAIILYLADQKSRLAPSPARPRGRADCLKWLFFLSNTLHADLNMRFYAEQYIADNVSFPRFYEINGSRILADLKMLDDAIGEHGKLTFLASGLSVCDFYLGCLVRWIQIYPIGSCVLQTDGLLKFENLTKVLRAIEERPSVRRSLMRENIAGPAFVNPGQPRSANAAIAASA